jgi:hypothetical protein
MYAMSPLCYSLHMSFVGFKCEYIQYMMHRTNIPVMVGSIRSQNATSFQDFGFCFSSLSFLSCLPSKLSFQLQVLMVWKHVQVLELWTRRQFRCDCGNSKFGVGICQLQANKEPENSCNIYNQNYKGVYCICKRPHPDPDLPEQSEMLQCCICEDWFHEHHLGLPPPLQVLSSGFCCQEMFIKKWLLCHVRVYVYNKFPMVIEHTRIVKIMDYLINMYGMVITTCLSYCLGSLLTLGHGSELTL